MFAILQMKYVYFGSHSEVEREYIEVKLSIRGRTDGAGTYEEEGLHKPCCFTSFPVGEERRVLRERDGEEIWLVVDQDVSTEADILNQLVDLKRIRPHVQYIERADCSVWDEVSLEFVLNNPLAFLPETWKVTYLVDVY